LYTDCTLVPGRCGCTRAKISSALACAPALSASYTARRGSVTRSPAPRIAAVASSMAGGVVTASILPLVLRKTKEASACDELRRARLVLGEIARLTVARGAAAQDQHVREEQAQGGGADADLHPGRPWLAGDVALDDAREREREHESDDDGRHGPPGRRERR